MKYETQCTIIEKLSLKKERIETYHKESTVCRQSDTHTHARTRTSIYAPQLISQLETLRPCSQQEFGTKRKKEKSPNHGNSTRNIFLAHKGRNGDAYTTFFTLHREMCRLAQEEWAHVCVCGEGDQVWSHLMRCSIDHPSSDSLGDAKAALRDGPHIAMEPRGA